MPINCNCDPVALWRECEPWRNYMCYLDTNLRELCDERNRLSNKITARKDKISNAENRGMRATDTLNGWLERAEKMVAEVDAISGTNRPDTCAGGCCYSSLADLKSAYKLGSSAANMLQKVASLCDENLVETEMFAKVKMHYLPVKDNIVGLDLKFKEIWDHLANQSEEKNSPFIRICGMGGVGKTVLLKKINNQFLEKTLSFNQIIFVDATESTNVPILQVAIGRSLGLDWSENEMQHTRATNINFVLKKEKFVLFIDNPHGDITLADVGIPTQYNTVNKYKVVFATREETVTLGMGGDEYHKITMGCLDPEHAHKLFEQTVGREVLNSHPAIPDLVEKVANLCDGLPLTLVTVGQAMSSKTTPEAWKHTVDLLTTAAHQFEDMKGVYEKFRVSYDGLPEMSRRCFLYCSLFPKNSLIDAEQLVDYWIGQSFLNSSTLLCKLRNHGHYIISTLHDAKLLDSRADPNTVGMHNTIRHSALWIANQSAEPENKFWVQSGVSIAELPTDNGINWAEVERISLVRCDIIRLNVIQCSRLSTLILKHSTISETSLGFFQPMVRLKVLDLSGCNLDRFPADITALTELQYLNLSRTYISELPYDFNKLAKLKILNLSFMKTLHKIPPGVMKSLSKLQALNLYGCGFESKMVEGSFLSGGGEALLGDVESLAHLEDLRFTVASAVSLQIFGKSNKAYCTRSLFVTNCQGSKSLPLIHFEKMEVFRVFKCPSLEEVVLGGSFGSLLHVEIESCWALENLTWLKNAPTLQSLRVIKCATMKEIISDVGTRSGAGTNQDQLFSNLKSIYLSHLPAVHSICSNNVLPFPQLEEITVLYCPNMVKLPLNVDNAKQKLKLIRGHAKWWEELKLGDNEATKLSFKSYFVLVKEEREHVPK